MREKPKVKAASKYLRPCEAAEMLGIGRDSMSGLGLERIDMRQPGSPRPQWRYLRTGVEHFIVARTQNARHAA